MSPKNPAAVALGRVKSPRKAAAARANGKLGGRPTKAGKPKRRELTVEKDEYSQ